MNHLVEKINVDTNLQYFYLFNSVKGKILRETWIQINIEKFFLDHRTVVILIFIHIFNLEYKVHFSAANMMTDVKAVFINIFWFYVCIKKKTSLQIPENE